MNAPPIDARPTAITPPRPTKRRQLRVRDARPADAAAIASIYNESVAAGDATMDLDPWSANTAVAKLVPGDPREAWLVLERDGRVIGWGALKAYSERRGYRFACEVSIYLRRAETGGGLATPLMDELLQRAHELDYHHLVAKVFADNAASVRFLTRHGFELVGVQKEIGFIRDRWVSIAVLQCVLREVRPGAAV